MTIEFVNAAINYLLTENNRLQVQNTNAQGRIAELEAQLKGEEDAGNTESEAGEVATD